MCRVSVLIPTRNRPQKIMRLLASLEQSSVKPSQIIIVASGEDIEQQIEIYRKNLNITYFHTEVAGQVAQKKLGISLLNGDIDWCIFLDDDLLVGRQAIEFALKEVNSVDTSKIIGVGFALPPTTRTLAAKNVTLRIAKVFNIGNGSLGKVLKSGHANSYLQSKAVIETEWLNGASMWRDFTLPTYGQGMPSTPYAACEDLIFSYPLRKVGRLIYCPQARLEFQEEEKSNFDSARVLEAASFWRFYFVKCNSELSVSRFLLSQIGRIIFASLNTKGGSLKMIWSLTKVQLRIVSCIIRNESPERLLNQLVD
jgi:GT2 family glycosyltransferase